MNLPRTLAASLLMLGCTSCGSFYIASDAYDRTDRLAVVSLSLDGLDAGGTVPAHIPAITAELLEQAEHLLDYKFELVAIESLEDKYGAIGSRERLGGIYTPMVGNVAMANFETDRTQVAASKLTPATIDRLTEALDVDAVAVIYTKWGTSNERTKDHVINRSKDPENDLQVIVTKLMPVVTTTLGVYRRGGDTVFEDTEKTIVRTEYVDSGNTAKNVEDDRDARRAMVKAYAESLAKMVNQIR